MKFAILILLSCLAFIMSVEAEAQSKVIHIGVKAQLVKSWHKTYSEYLLIKSPPFYQERDSESSTKGYKVERSQIVKGSYSREVFDYESKQSSLNVYEQITSSINASNFELLFTCKGQECGDVDAWELYLSRLIYGDADKQYFGVAKKRLDDGDFEYISYYVTEIDGQPRTLIDVLNSPKENNFDIIVDSTQITKSLTKDGRVILDGINFSIGSAKLKPEANLSIRKMSEIIKTSPNGRFAIVGHTDNTGDYLSNLKLSKNRANSVKLQLINKYAVNKEQIIVNGVGPLSPLTSNIDEAGRSLNRRVELVQL